MTERQTTTLRRLAAAGLWILIAATNPLWLATNDFPQIPFLAFCSSIPNWVDYTLLGLLAIASFQLATGRERTRRTWKCGLVAACLLSALTILNQHRFQPWVYLTIVQFVILSIPDANSKLALKLLRFVFASIYVYSAISKLDHAFSEHLGLRFVDTMLDQIGANPHLMGPGKKQWLVWLIPIGELIVGFGLAFPPTRRFAVGLAVVQHALLVVILGPWGLNHHLGVLIWNVLFAAEVIIAFGTAPDADDDPADEQVRSPSSAVAMLITIACLLLPLIEVANGPFDHWPAWSLYSDRTDKVEFFIDSKHSSELPPSVLGHLGPPIPFQPWRKLYLEQFSLSETQAPIYPEDRFQMGVALDITNRFKFASEQTSVRLIVHSPPDRRTGERQSTTYVGANAITEAMQNFRLNVKARTTISADASQP